MIDPDAFIRSDSDASEVLVESKGVDIHLDLGRRQLIQAGVRAEYGRVMSTRPRITDLKVVA